MNKKQKALYERAKSVKNKEELKKVLKAEEQMKKKDAIKKVNPKLLYLVGGGIVALILFVVFVIPLFNGSTTQTQTPDTLKAIIETNMGNIEATLDYKTAKSTIDVFKQNVEKGIYTGSFFNQILPGSMIRGGVPMGENRSGMGANDTIPAVATGVKHEKYTIGFPQHGTNANKTQFYILLSDQLQMDKEPPVDAMFGKITKGTEIVDKLAQVKVVAQGKNDFGFDEKQVSRPESEEEVRIKKITIEQ